MANRYPELPSKPVTTTKKPMTPDQYRAAFEKVREAQMAFEEVREAARAFGGEVGMIHVDKKTFNRLIRMNAETMNPYCAPLRLNKNTYFMMGATVRVTRHKKKHIRIDPL